MNTGVTPSNIVVGITGATGALYALRILQVLRSLTDQGAPRFRVHVVISKAGLISFQHELAISRRALLDWADESYGIDDITAPIASGSFPVAAMVIAPCSMKTLASVALGLSDNLIARAADVMLKERRKLVLMTRETPLNNAHLKNMLAVSEMGGIISPPMPSFYHHPSDIAQIVDYSVGRVLAQMGIDTDLAPPWRGLNPP